MSAPRALSTISALPASGIVSSLSQIKIAFIGASSLSIENGPVPTLESIDGASIACQEAKIETNALLLKFDPAVTAPGSYVLKISRSFIKVDDSFLESDVTFSYFISTIGDNGIMYEAPEGTKVVCQSDFLSYFVVDGGLSGMPLAGKPLHYVLGKDGNLYLYNPITIHPYGGTQTASYIKGVPSGEKKWKFSFPQPIYETYEDGKPQVWYANYICKTLYASGKYDFKKIIK